MPSATIWRSSSSDGASSVGHDPGHDPLAPFRIGPLPDRHLGHAGVRDQDALDRIGPDLLGSGRDDVVDAARDDELSLGVESPGVAGGEPVPRPSGPTTRPVVSVPVAAEQHRGPDQDLAFGAAPPSACRPSPSSARSHRTERQLDPVERPSVVDDARARLGHAVGGDDVGRQLVGSLLPPRSTQVKTEGSRRWSAVATNETWVTRPERPASSTASASNPGRTTRGVPVTIERVTTAEPPDVRERQAGQPRVPVGVDAEPGRGRLGRGGHGVVGEHDALGMTRRARGGDDQRVALLDPDAVAQRVLLAVGAHDPRGAQCVEQHLARRSGAAVGSSGAAASPVSQMARRASTKPMPPGRSSATSSGTGQ